LFNDLFRFFSARIADVCRNTVTIGMKLFPIK
jgi:hypothetical protein